jgi:hypothetical protein
MVFCANANGVEIVIPRQNSACNLASLRVTATAFLALFYIVAMALLTACAIAALPKGHKST